MVPPVPIPNTEVKHCRADDSAAIGCAKVGRCQSLNPTLRSGVFFMLADKHSSNNRSILDNN